MGSPSLADRTIAVIGLLIAAASLYVAWLAYANLRPKEAGPSSEPPTPEVIVQVVQSAAAEPVEVEPRVLSSYSGEAIATATPAPPVKVYEPPPEVKPRLETLNKATSNAVAPPLKPALSSFSSALLSAASLGNHDSVKRWLESGADPNAASDDGKTPLMLAAQYGHHDICKTLILAGASTTIKDQRGRNPLHYAAESGHNDVVKYLLDQGTPAHAIDIDGNTPFTLAQREGHNTCASAIWKVVRVMETPR